MVDWRDNTVFPEGSLVVFDRFGPVEVLLSINGLSRTLEKTAAGEPLIGTDDFILAAVRLRESANRSVDEFTSFVDWLTYDAAMPGSGQLTLL